MNVPARIGLLGGSFNPIHQGHLIMAEHAREQLVLDRVLLAPAGNPPHKVGLHLAPTADRLEMVRLAIEGNDGLACSKLDADETEPSFTWKLLERLRDDQPEARLWFLMGGDSLADFPGWSRPERILELARLAVIERPGFEADLDAFYSNSVDSVETPLCAISSSDIRDRVREQTSIRYLVPDAVRRHIERRGLYR